MSLFSLWLKKRLGIPEIHLSPAEALPILEPVLRAAATKVGIPAGVTDALVSEIQSQAKG